MHPPKPKSLTLGKINKGRKVGGYGASSSSGHCPPWHRPGVKQVARAWPAPRLTTKAGPEGLLGQVYTYHRELCTLSLQKRPCWMPCQRVMISRELKQTHDPLWDLLDETHKAPLHSELQR